MWVGVSLGYILNHECHRNATMDLHMCMSLSPSLFRSHIVCHWHCVIGLGDDATRRARASSLGPSPITSQLSYLP